MFTTGVVIGRFQVPELHEGHKALIDYVADKHDDVIVFVGTAPFRFTKRNPLPPEAVEQLLWDHVVNYHNKVLLHNILDRRTDAEWTENLDTIIENATKGSKNVTLYTGRDGFNVRYTGKYPVEVVDLKIDVSATEMRKQLAPNFGDYNFRAGIIYAIEHQYPLAPVCVDAIILDQSHDNILLVRKHGETQWRFPGGFVDPEDTSLEHAVRREITEETVLQFYSDPVYKFSTQVKDWRSSLLTNVFEVEATAISAVFDGTNEEIAEQRWFSFGYSGTNAPLVPEHKPILDLYRTEKYK